MGLFPLVFFQRRIYRAAMRDAVNRVPAETDCPGWGLGKTGGEALPAVKLPGLVGFRGILANAMPSQPGDKIIISRTS